MIIRSILSMTILVKLSSASDDYFDHQAKTLQVKPFEFLFVDMVNEPHECIKKPDISAKIAKELADIRVNINLENFENK